MTWTDTELAYMAGIIDGEGTISVRRRKNQPGTRLTEENKQSREELAVRMHGLNKRGKAA